MASTNRKTKRPALYTNEGGRATPASNIDQLRRTVMSCFLWERDFYEDGIAIADRIRALAEKADPQELADLAFEVRTQGNLRHVPLLLLEVLSRTGKGKGELVASAIERTIQRADEMGEFLAICKGKNKKLKMSNPMRTGLARAFTKFDEHQLAKYNRDDAAFKIRDVMFLSHVKPINAAHKKVMVRVKDEQLKTPDTWEVALSAGKDKGKTFARLIKDGELGYMALLRNLRNMEQAGVDTKLVNDAIRARKNGAWRVLPFRFTAAARAAPKFERALDDALCANIEALPKLPGETVVLVDVSGSMDYKLSGKSDLKRIDAAATLASIINADDLNVYTFSNNLVKTKARRGMAGVEEIIRSQPHGGTWLGKALTAAYAAHPKLDRIIIVTDEQSHDTARFQATGETKAYVINVGVSQNGVSYKNGVVHIDGFSESVIKYIAALEGIETPAFVLGKGVDGPDVFGKPTGSRTVIRKGGTTVRARKATKKPAKKRKVSARKR